jgi:hypothetical protein
MTNNRDPNRPDIRDRFKKIRSDDGSWSAIPLLVFLAVVIGAGVMLFSADWYATTSKEQTTEPTTSPPPASTPPAATPKTGPSQ